MNKQQTKVKQYLQRAYRVDQRIEAKFDQIRSLQELATRISPFYTDMPGKTDRGTSKIENAVVEIASLEEEIAEDALELVGIKREIFDAIRQVDDPEGQLILEKRYMLYESWEDIVLSLDCSMRKVFQVHDESLKKIAIS